MKRPDLDYDALCLDTCVLDSQGIAFERGLLKQLDQFASGPVKLLIPEIVHNEVQKHLEERVHDSRTKVARALRIAKSELQVTEDNLRIVEQILLGGENQKLAPQYLEEFYSRTNAQLLKSSQADVARLVDMYFAAKPPFEDAGDKKAEFPDAIALLSIEAWAVANECKVLVVSTDDGWQEFCETSGYLDIVRGLADALAHFQPHNVATALIRELKIQLSSCTSSGIPGAITEEIARSVESAPVRAHASSSYYLDERYVDAAYVSHEYHRNADRDLAVNLVRISSDGIVLQLSATVSSEVTAEYGISVRDPIDRDYVGLGRTKIATTATFEADILVSLVGDFARGLEGIDAGEIEVGGSLHSVDFGDIDPDPERDEWDREKYD